MHFKSFLNRLFETGAVDRETSDRTVPAFSDAKDRQSNLQKSEITELFRSALEEKQRDMLLRRADVTDPARTDCLYLTGPISAGLPRQFRAQVLRLPITSPQAGQTQTDESHAGAKGSTR